MPLAPGAEAALEETEAEAITAGLVGERREAPPDRPLTVPQLSVLLTLLQEQSHIPGGGPQAEAGALAKTLEGVAEAEVEVEVGVGALPTPLQSPQTTPPPMPQDFMFQVHRKTALTAPAQKL